MADLNRQLQDYLAESKSSGGGGRKSPLQDTLSSSEAGSGGWLEALLPSSSPSSVGWPWSPSSPAAPAAGAVDSPCLPALSRAQRLAGSAVLALLSALCLTLAALYVPLMALRARRFALLWSLGSGLALAAAALLLGAGAGRRLAREPAGLLYLAALSCTLWAALGPRSTGLAVLGAAAQALALFWLLVVLVPGGATGLRYLSGLCGALLRRRVREGLPV